jgi:hypothetical protein
MTNLPPGAEDLTLVAAVVCGAIAGLLVFSLAVWTARDIAARSPSRLARAAALLLVLFVPLFGLVIYLLLRPRETVADRYERQLIEEILAREVSGLPAARRVPQATGSAQPE